MQGRLQVASQRTRSTIKDHMRLLLKRAAGQRGPFTRHPPVSGLGLGCSAASRTRLLRRVGCSPAAAACLPRGCPSSRFAFFFFGLAAAAAAPACGSGCGCRQTHPDKEALGKRAGSTNRLWALQPLGCCTTRQWPTCACSSFTSEGMPNASSRSRLRAMLRAAEVKCC